MSGDHARAYAEVIGDPIGHSKSPTIHRFWLAEAGIDADYRATRVMSADLADYVAQRRSDPAWRGANVTIPHKQAVIPLLDRLDPAAARIGAVNCIRPEGGALVGYNSDLAGFLEPLRSRLARPHLFRMARVLGAGGAARAIVHALAGQGFTLVVAARDVAKARALLDETDGGAMDVATDLAALALATDFAWDDRQGVFDIVVNATSLGMAGCPPLRLDFSHVPPGSLVYDIVYAPLETPLLAEARRRGHQTIDGLAMLIGQAAVAFELFFATPAPRARDDILRGLLTA